MYQLSDQNLTNIFSKHILRTSENLGQLRSAHRKRAFDVLLEFDNHAIVIETKVDSQESGGFDTEWQTTRIYNTYHDYWPSKKVHFLFITYGLSEFYIKQTDDGNFNNGPGSTSFKHITAEVMLNFTSSSLQQLESNHISEELLVWKRWLAFEIEKRKKLDFYLENINNLLTEYKSFLGLTDFPVNRMTLHTPEFTVPHYYNIATEWNHKYAGQHGHLSLYRVNRMYTVLGDVILNFTELWNNESFTFNGLLDPNNGFIYFEINEDFNLHLKAMAETRNIEIIFEFIKKNHPKLSIKGINSAVEDYKQGAYVLYEWDLGLLSNNIPEITKNIDLILSTAKPVIR